MSWEPGKLQIGCAPNKHALTLPASCDYLVLSQVLVSGIRSWSETVSDFLGPRIVPSLIVMARVFKQHLAILRAHCVLFSQEISILACIPMMMFSQLSVNSEDVPLYQPAKALPIELQEQCAIYLEEGLRKC